MSSIAPASPYVVNDPRLVFDPASHTYQLGEQTLPSVTAILQEARIADFSAPWFTADILTRGRYIHDAILLDTQGDLDDATLDPVLAPYVAGWRAFCADTGCVIEHWERPVCDPVLGYAGTLDGIVRLADGARVSRVLIDVKSGLYPSVGPQTAAYRRLAQCLYDSAVVMRRAALVLPGDGRYRLEPLTDISDDSVFLAALRIVTWRRAHGYDQ